MNTLQLAIKAAQIEGRWKGELWNVTTERTRTHQTFTIQSESGVKIADTVEDHRDVDGLANARKIAAAPALHFALANLQANPNDARAHRIALDALALLNAHHGAWEMPPERGRSDPDREPNHSDQ